MSEAERFWPKVNKTEGCWLWTAARFGDGYGKFARTGGRSERAHRMSWEFANGAIPSGMCICHHCDEPLCVNPGHLFLGTRGDNNSDRGRKGRGFDNKGESHPHTRLTAADVITIRSAVALFDANRRRLGEVYGVTGTAISEIVCRKNWRHV